MYVKVWKNTGMCAKGCQKSKWFWYAVCMLFTFSSVQSFVSIMVLKGCGIALFRTAVVNFINILACVFLHKDSLTINFSSPNFVPVAIYGGATLPNPALNKKCWKCCPKKLSVNVDEIDTWKLLNKKWLI